MTLLSMLALGILAGVGVAILGRALQPQGSLLGRVAAAVIGLVILGATAWYALLVMTGVAGTPAP
jgi:hypothetical protein